MKYYGVVICLAKNKTIVTTNDFQCFYIKRTPTTYVGKQIEFTEKEIIRKRSALTKLMLSAACIAIIFFIASVSNFLGISNIKNTLFESKIFAYVDVDINPSLELEIDDMGNVLRLNPLNEDAKVLVKKLNLSKASVSQAVDVLLGEINRNKAASKSGNDYILVSSTLNSQKNESDKEYKAEKEKLDNLMSSLKNNIQEKENGKVNVILVQTNIRERKEARKEGISTGRYMFYNKYKSLKDDLSIEKIKKISVNELIKNLLNDKTGSDNYTATPASTSSPLNAKNNTRNVFTTPSSNSDLNSKVPDNNSLLKNNYTKLNTPSPSLSTIPFLIPSSVPILSPSPTIQITNSTFVKFESYNYPGRFIRHESLIGHLSENVTPVEDSEFKMVSGLADPNCISFESKNFPGYYLMHENFKIVLKKNDESTNFKECATFRKVPGLADNNLISFQSFNYPNRYIRHMMFFLQIDEILSDLDKKDSTFKEIKVD